MTALALLQRSLVALTEYDFPAQVSAELSNACDEFAAALPGLKDVRDSAAHVEERVRGEALGKKIATQPVTNSMIPTPGS